MTIKKAIADLAEIKPHQYSDTKIVELLYKLDAQIYDEVIIKHQNTNETGNGDLERPAAYDAEQDINKELLVPDPYSDMYLSWLAAQVDYWNGEYTRFNNTITMYNNDYDIFASWFTRTHMPKQPAVVEV